MTAPDVGHAAEIDDTIPRVTRAIGAFSCLFALVGYIVSDRIAALPIARSVLIGGAITASNLLVLTRVIRSMTGPARGAIAWTLVYVGKLVALFGGTYVLINRGWVSAIGVGGGFAALLPAVVLVALRPTAEAGPKAP